MGLFSKIGQLFGLKSGEKAQTYSGPKPYSSLKETPEGKLYADTLTQRLAGQGVGYEPDFLSKTISPYARSRMDTLKNYELPVISAQATARGLGRSSIPVNRSALSTQEASRDIESRVAQLSLQNEQQKRDEINNALSALGAFGQAEAGQKATSAAFDYGNWANTQAQRQAINNQQLSGLGNLFGLGASAISGGLSGNSISNNYSNINSLIQKLRNPGLINVG